MVGSTAEMGSQDPYCGLWLKRPQQTKPNS